MLGALFEPYQRSASQDIISRSLLAQESCMVWIDTRLSRCGDRLPCLWYLHACRVPLSSPVQMRGVTRSMAYLRTLTARQAAQHGRQKDVEHAHTAHPGLVVVLSLSDAHQGRSRARAAHLHRSLGGGGARQVPQIAALAQGRFYSCSQKQPLLPQLPQLPPLSCLEKSRG